MANNSENLFCLSKIQTMLFKINLDHNSSTTYDKTNKFSKNNLICKDVKDKELLTESKPETNGLLFFVYLSRNFKQLLLSHNSFSLSKKKKKYFAVPFWALLDSYLKNTPGPLRIFLTLANTLMQSFKNLATFNNDLKALN